MEQKNTAKYKSKKFSVRIIKLYKYLCENHREYDIFKQLLRCGTSIGANIAEAECGISKKDFLAKIYIALKERAETIYWLELLFESEYLTKEQFILISIKNNKLNTQHSTLHS